MHMDTFRMDGGVVISPSAFNKLVDDEGGCSLSSWFRPKYAGKALLMCARNRGITEWAPVDNETGQPLFITTDVRTLFLSNGSSIRSRASSPAASGNASNGGTGDSTGGTAITGCCSHRVIIFGALNYRDQRLIHFFADSTFSAYGL